MKTAELTGALLDYWVARAEGVEVKAAPGNVYPHILRMSDGTTNYIPSADWSYGGPIIEREKIDIEHTNWIPSLCYAKLLGDEDGSTRRDGPTPLIAAMRCYVASKFGDEVPDTTEKP